MRVHSLDREDLLEEEMATPSSTLAWRIPWTEEPGGLTLHSAAEPEATSPHTSRRVAAALLLLLLFTRPRRREAPLAVLVGMRCSFPAPGMGSGQDGAKEMGMRVS